MCSTVVASLVWQSILLCMILEILKFRCPAQHLGVQRANEQASITLEHPELMYIDGGHLGRGDGGGGGAKGAETNQVEDAWCSR